MEATFPVAVAERGLLERSLIICAIGFWMLLLAGVWLLSPEIGVPLIIGTLAIGIAAGLVTHPVVAVYLLIVAGPFYDILRGWFFPGVELLGFWQDALTAILWIAAIRNMIKNGRPKLIALDGFVVGFIGAYAFSVVVSANTSVWFYGFRWFVLYPAMYLALRSLSFDAQQQRRMLWLFIVSLFVSAVVGLLGMWYLGWDAAVEFYRAMDLSIYSRNDLWRWAATFSNPITASGAFALLFLAFFAMFGFTRSRTLCLTGCAFAAFCIYMTHSRSGAVIAAAGALATLFAFRLRIARVLLILAVLSSLVLAVHVINSFDEWDTLRLQQFSRTITEAFSSYPLGTGAGTAGAVSMAAASFAGKDGAGVDTVVGDSVALTVLRDTGWPGLFSYAGVVIGVVSLSWRMRGTLVGVLAFAYWVGSAVNLMNATDVYPVRLYLWLLAGLTASLGLHGKNL